MTPWSDLFFSFEGRIGRRSYWIGIGVLTLLSLSFMLLGSALGSDRYAAIIDTALIYPEFAVALKRAHDRDLPLWMLIVNFALEFATNAVVVFGLDGAADEPSALYWIVSLPWLAIGLFLLVQLGFYKGTPGPNRFGPDPLGKG